MAVQGRPARCRPADVLRRLPANVLRKRPVRALHAGGAALLLALAAAPACLAAGGDPPHSELPGLVELNTVWNGRVFCTARTTTAQDLTLAVAAFSHAHPELAGHLNSEQTLRALAERYPCDDSSLPTHGADARLRHAFADISAPLRSSLPLYGQLLSLSLPAEFDPMPVFDSGQDGPQYRRELVLQGESREDWSQRLTIAAERGVTAARGRGPKNQVEAAAAGVRQDCPESFVVSRVAVAPISGFEAFAAVVSCGTSPLTRGRTSETSMILAIEGQSDLYTLTWAERGMPWSTPMAIDGQAWLDRLERLVPIKLCPLLAGELPPYPSCIAHP